MKLIAIIFIIYLFLKSIYYGIFELTDNKNKPGGIVIIVIAIIGLIFPLSLLIFYFYRNYDYPRIFKSA